jgi:hypothetical protein
MRIPKGYEDSSEFLKREVNNQLKQKEQKNEEEFT